MRIPWFALILVLGGCRNDSEPSGNAAANQSQQTFQQELKSLPDSGRNLAFRNAVRDTGLKCERVDQSHLQQGVKGGEMWVAHCTDIGDVALFISQAGYAEVRRCADLEESEAPQCKGR
jgi:hypothetical protein